MTEQLQLVPVIEQFSGQSNRDSFLRNYISPNVSSELVLQAFIDINRADFVPKEYLSYAWSNEIIPVEQATISEPALVAKMINMLNPTGNGTILEIGTASGLTAAYVSRCARQVHTTEIQSHLAHTASERLARLGYANIAVHEADGLSGLPMYGPYEGIIVTASARYIPQTLIEQLQEGGRIVIPVGEDDFEKSTLVLGTRKGENLTLRPLGPVGFMPLVSEYDGGWTESDLTVLQEQKNKHYADFVEQIAVLQQTTVAELKQQCRQQLRKQFGPDVNPSEDELNRYITEEVVKQILPLT